MSIQPKCNRQQPKQKLNSEINRRTTASVRHSRWPPTFNPRPQSLPAKLQYISQRRDHILRGQLRNTGTELHKNVGKARGEQGPLTVRSSTELRLPRTPLLHGRTPLAQMRFALLQNSTLLTLPIRVPQHPLLRRNELLLGDCTRISMLAEVHTALLPHSTNARRAMTRVRIQQTINSKMIRQSVATSVRPAPPCASQKRDNTHVAPVQHSIKAQTFRAETRLLFVKPVRHRIP